MDPTVDDLLARLRRNPDDLEALAVLKGHFRQQGDYDGLARMLEGWAARCRDRRAAAEGLREAADVVASLMGDRERAVSLLTRALERDPQNAAAADMVERILVDAGDHERLVEVLERRATALGAAKGHPAETAALHHRLGQLWEQQLQRVDRAVFHYRKAFELDPALLEAIYAARQIYLTAGNSRAASTLYDLEANAETDVPRKVALLRELAQLRLDQLADIEGAVVALKRAHAADANDLAVKHELATALMTRAGPMGEAGAKDRRRAAELFFELAMAVPEHALSYCEATLDAVPGHTQAMDMLERLADEQNRTDVLPPRWVQFLVAAPDSPGADQRRQRLGHAYVAAGQVDDAIACFEPLLDQGGIDVAQTLVDLYRQAGRDKDIPTPLSVLVDRLPEAERPAHLRGLVEVLLAHDRRDEAVTRARQLLDVDPADDDSLALVDSHYRAQGDHATLRDLLTRLAQAPHLSEAARKARWLEVARLSEEQLSDVQGALAAWREVVQLDRTDGEAQQARLRLLEQEGRWDDAAWALSSWLEVEADPAARADILARLAEVHRERRADPYAAIDTLRSLRELRPEDDAARTALCELLLQVDRALDAIPVLRESVERAADMDERVRLLRRLATVLAERAGNLEEAFRTWREVLDLSPEDLEALDQMERIDLEQQRYDRLLETLGLRVDVVPPEERPAVLCRMGALADERLGDLDASAAAYEQALDLEPNDDATAVRLMDVLARAQRWDDLVVLLAARAARTEDPAARTELHRRRARTLAQELGNADAAADAWRAVLDAGEDEEALRALRRHADERDDADELSEWLGRLAELVASTDEKRALLMERADLLAGPLANPQEAQAVLRRVVTELAEDDVPALVRLAEVCEQVSDDRGLADALDRHLRIAGSPEERVPLATRLAELMDGPLDDRDGAIEAFTAWTEADPQALEARQRLAELLEEVERWGPLVGVLDALAKLEGDDEATKGERLRRAAAVAVHHLGDVDGAWARLAPLVEGGDAQAEEDLQELALGTGRAQALADLYVKMAKAAEDPVDQRTRWADASRILESHVDDPQKALEAMLRAFAVDVTDESLLGEVERLATAAGAWLRLAQVYEALIRKADPHDARRLLLRHAELLESKAEDASAAFDRILRAAALDPMDDEILARAEALGKRAGRTEELLVLYDRRRGQAPDAATQLEALVRAVRLCETVLEDRERSAPYLRDAVHVALPDADLLETLEREAHAMDSDAGGDGIRRALVGAYRLVAEGRGEPGATLMLRGAQLLMDELSDPDAAYQLLTLATELAPSNSEVLDAYEAAAGAQGRLDALDAQLVKLIEESIDSRTAAALLRRRGRLLEEAERLDDAAEVYQRLTVLAPDDAAAFERLRACLRQAGKLQDLLLVLDRQLGKTKAPEARVELLREVAHTWEQDLHNRWESHDAWKRLLAVAPDDAEAKEAVARLGKKSRLSDDERLFADEAEEAEVNGAHTEAAEAAQAKRDEAKADGEGEETTEEEAKAEADEDADGDEAGADEADEAHAKPGADEDAGNEADEAAAKAGTDEAEAEPEQAKPGADDAAAESEITEEIEALDELDVLEESAAPPRPRSLPPPPPGKE
jgi:tetratricopeptide (TPR) repeat protein